MKLSRFARFTWGALAVNMLVILWGAFVRASGSGAGCGSHWPTCNGVILPLSPEWETLVEYIHRLTSGVALLMVIALLIYAWRGLPEGHPAQRGAIFSMGFMITEALVGATLVLFQWVAKDASIGRVIFISIHLVNTFLLLASLTLTAWWASGGGRLDLKARSGLRTGFGVAFIGMILIGISGAITALGDTLFPAVTLQEALRQDISLTAHLTIRLRVWHPVLAALVSFWVGFLVLWQFNSYKVGGIRRLAAFLGVLILIQLGAGLVNLALLAPVGMQLVHLFLADLVWIGLVLLFAVSFQEKPLTSEKLS